MSGSALFLNAVHFAEQGGLNVPRSTFPDRNSPDVRNLQPQFARNAAKKPLVKLGFPQLACVGNLESQSLAGHDHRLYDQRLSGVKAKMRAGVRLAKHEWAEKVVSLRSKLGLRQVEFAHRFGVTQAAVSRWESGAKEPGRKTYAEMGNIAGEPDCWYFWKRAGLDKGALIEQVPLTQPTVQTSVQVEIAGRSLRQSAYAVKKIPDAVAIPLLKDAAAAGPPRSIDERDVDERLVVPRRMCPHPDDTVCIRVSGDSMSPVLEDEYVVAVDTKQQDPLQLYNQMVVARDPEGGVTIKWLRKVDDELMLLPQHTSVRHPPTLISKTSGWKIVGRVLWWIGEPK
jgi:phage repressor protein C with HTH and peptisase S24 domain